MTPTQDQILALADAGKPVDEIVTATNVSPGYIYGLLREHRPDRPRKQRERTSALRLRILLERAQGKTPEQIREQFVPHECSRQYVHRILGEA